MTKPQKTAALKERKKRRGKKKRKNKGSKQKPNTRRSIRNAKNTNSKKKLDLAPMSSVVGVLIQSCCKTKPSPATDFDQSRKAVSASHSCLLACVSRVTSRDSPKLRAYLQTSKLLSVTSHSAGKR